MGRSLPIFLDEVADYKVRAGRMHIIWGGLEIVLPLHVMLKGMASARRAVDEWHEREGAKVVELRRKH